MHFCLVLLWLSIYSVSAELLILPWPDQETELPLWKPDAPSSEKWPAIIYYHGTNGHPSIRLMREVTEEKGFLLVMVKGSPHPA
ncbi:MAG: hypothetical protein ABF370_03200 [Verrucomicrobiales bacterium]